MGLVQQIGRLAMLLALLAWSLGCARGEETRLLPLANGAQGGLEGRLLFAREDGFWVLDLARGEMRRLTSLAPRTSVGNPALSPDGRLVAYSLASWGLSAEQPGGADLYVMNVDGSQQRQVLPHDGPWVALSEPAWAPDGQTLYFSRTTFEGATRIERVRLDGSGRTVVVEDGYSPALTSDGQYLAYLRSERGAGMPTLWVMRSDGSERWPVLGPPQFIWLEGPRFVPGGQEIIVAAAENPEPVSRRRGAWEGVFTWLSVPVAWAHGLPMDLWQVPLRGGTPLRVTEIGQHIGAVAWSPDRQRAVLSGEAGLYVLDLTTRAAQRLELGVTPMSAAVWLP
jgi:Tol biopolymer transport system component